MLSEYKAYSAKISVDEELDVFHGQVLGISDVVTFQGRTPEELARAFHESVDDYLAFCRERGDNPDKPYSGRFVLRITPELHREVSVAAKQSDVSMNEWIVRILEHALEGAISTACPAGAERATPD